MTTATPPPTAAPTTDPTEDYFAVRQHLEGLEREQATIAEEIRRAAVAGKNPTALMAREIALPTLIDQARRQLAPLELRFYEHQIARVQAEAAGIGDELAVAQAVVEDAEAARRRLVLRAQQVTATRRDLENQRRDAWRRLQQFTDPTPPRPEARVVTSAWQRRAGD